MAGMQELIRNTLNSKPISKDTVIRMGIDICKALEFCSKSNIIHHDVKPSNIFLTKWGGFKLGDFSASTQITDSQKQDRMGTLKYMAPEVYAGKPFSPNIDTYSLGLVMYELLKKTTNSEEDDLAKRFSGTLALLTDSHNRDMSTALSSLRIHRPDLILIAGDFIYGNAPVDGSIKMEESYNAMSLLRGCSSIAPTFVSLGNHEWMLSPADLRLIESTGVIVLDNTFTTTIINGKKIVVAGLTSARVTEYQTFRTEYVGSSHFSAESELYPQLTCSATHPLPNTSWITEMERQPGFKY